MRWASKGLLLLLLPTLLLPSSVSDTQSLIPGEDYVQGELLVRFSTAYMPSKMQVSLTASTFGIQGLDSVLAIHQITKLTKFLKTYGTAKSQGGRRLERTFRIRYSDGTDAQVLMSQLSQLPHFESVSLNKVLTKEFFGVKQQIPPTNTKFNKQWYFHSPGSDSIDIDAPEAWAIERGDPNVIIVIHDTGTMVDTTAALNWGLHRDFNFFWTSEDTFTIGALNARDINFTDSPGDLDD